MMLAQDTTAVRVSVEDCSSHKNVLNVHAALGAVLSTQGIPQR